ncbi:amino acid transporter AVT3C-like [Mangifera indica]|uniref:amino acid transporter AVT3C-like n=1 Tax=Mangifera indica TaxID=29780 RepID=UPI001CFA62DC|nr:amino acid transporter AVT3C-like [Mangifera indica]
MAKKQESSPLPTENTPLIGAETVPLSSQPKTFANVFIAIVGAGVLGLPYAFKRTGWLISLLLIFGVAALTYYCMMLLVYTRRKLESFSNGFAKINSFGDLGFAVCGSIGRFLVDVMIILSQVGFCIGYLIFISNSLFNLLDRKSLLGLSAKGFYIWMCFPFQLGLNSIATLTHLAPLSIFADIVDLGAMGVVMVEDVVVLAKHRPEVQAFGGWSMLFYGMGVVLYTFEGVGLILPLESEAEDKDKFGRTLGLSMAFIALMYGGFGALGYIAFGDATKDIITANMGPGFLTALVNIGLSINLFFTFPLSMNPVYEVVERRYCGGEYCLWMRWVLVFLVCMVALFVPNFADFMSLVGSSVCVGLAFVLPALFHFLVFKEEMETKEWVLDIGIVVLGIALAISGTWYSSKEILSVKV